MKVYENERVADWAVTQVQKRMGDKVRAGLPHASDIFGCIRKGILNRTDPKPLTRESILKFAVGFAMQEWFLGPEEDGEEVWGVIFSTDRTVRGQILEFKTTRQSYEALPKDPATGRGTGSALCAHTSSPTALTN